MIAAVDDTTLDYVVANRQVTFSPAPASGTLIVIKRQTSTERLVSWQDASVLKASDMTLAQVQQLHILEEQQDWIKTNSMVTDDENRWNALNHRIINVSDPINDQDAVTKNYVENLGNSFKTLLDTTTTQDIQRLESKTQEGLAALDLQTTLDLETLKALSEEMKEIAKDVNVFIPSVTENIISWTNKAGLPNPDPVNIKGEQGSSRCTDRKSLSEKKDSTQRIYACRICRRYPERKHYDPQPGGNTGGKLQIRTPANGTGNYRKMPAACRKVCPYRHHRSTGSR